jgi:hypothetical protein
MTSSAINILSGIAAAAAGLAGEKVSKDGAIPGLDLATILPAMLGKSGGIAGIMGGALASVAKTGLLKNSKLGNLAGLAGSLLSLNKPDTVKTATGGIASLAAAIIGNSGAGSLGSIATMASNLAKSAKDKNEVNGMASELGKILSGSFGVSLDGGGSALKALDKVMGNDTKGELFKAVLKGLS